MKKVTLLCSAFLFLFSFLQAQVQVNRYSKGNISENGISGKSVLNKEIIIAPPSIKEKIKQSTTGRQKFAIPLKVNIAPLERSKVERVLDHQVYRIKITATNAKSINVYFDKLLLSQNTEVYIYNPQGTIVTGPITSKENISEGRTWGSNIFPGTSLIIEIRAPITEIFDNQIHISKILYGQPIGPTSTHTDSTMGPGYGESSECHVNAICISGWTLERRAVCQIVDEEGGWCSGSLLTNTCNVNKPYILTANHCLLDGNNLVNTNNSTFEFLWYSPNCNPTTNTTSTTI